MFNKSQQTVALWCVFAAVQSSISPFAGSEKLSKGVAEQKWDQVKVVCTQPYNKVIMDELYVKAIGQITTISIFCGEGGREMAQCGLHKIIPVEGVW